MEISRERWPFEAEQVRQVIVRLAPSKVAVVDNHVIPDLNLQYIMAVMLVDKALSFRSAHDNRRTQDPAILRERAKVNIVPDDSLARLLPKETTIVEVILADGTRLRERVEAVRGRADKAGELLVEIRGKRSRQSTKTRIRFRKR